MTERENTSLPQKALKESTCVKTSVDEKVDAAREYINALRSSTESAEQASMKPGEWGGDVVEEALTALEERVAELEKERNTWMRRVADLAGHLNRTTENPNAYSDFVKQLQQGAPTDGK